MINRLVYKPVNKSNIQFRYPETPPLMFIQKRRRETDNNLNVKRDTSIPIKSAAAAGNRDELK